MKKVVISIRPEWVAKILNGEKTIEIRKTMPKCDLPCEVYIYCTKGGGFLGYDERKERFYVREDEPAYIYNGKIIAKFFLNKVLEIVDSKDMRTITHSSCVPIEDMLNYSKGGKLYAWQIGDWEMFGIDYKLKDFGLTKAPQSWCYVKE